MILIREILRHILVIGPTASPLLAQVSMFLSLFYSYVNNRTNWKLIPEAYGSHYDPVKVYVASNGFALTNALFDAPGKEPNNDGNGQQCFFVQTSGGFDYYCDTANFSYLCSSMPTSKKSL